MIELYEIICVPVCWDIGVHHTHLRMKGVGFRGVESCTLCEDGVCEYALLYNLYKYKHTSIYLSMYPIYLFI